MTQKKEIRITDTLPEGIDSIDEIPNCSEELCKELQDAIGRICCQKQWPPGQPVIIYQPDGKLCKCFCK
jgi:hypothetical protein